MKQSTTNTWNDGLNLDLHPIVTPNTVLTDNLNGTFITYNGNEFCLQNDKGNIHKCSLKEGFKPIGIKEHNGVIYIASVNKDGLGELGFYPGIKDWKTTEGELNYDVYSPLHNLYTSSVKKAYELKLTRWNGSNRNDIISLLGLFGVNEQTAEDKLKQWKDSIFIIYEKNFSKEQCINQLIAFNAFDNVEILSTITDWENPEISDFTTSELNFDLEHPVTIEVQDSYDGSVNLILTDDKNPPKIINTGFSVAGKKYSIITRNQTVETNIYSNDKTLKEQTNLVRITNIITNVSLEDVKPGGQLKGGNYKFYIKFGDADYNQSDIVAESGIVSIFNGTDGEPATITGTLADERTDKMIYLSVSGLNPAYSKVYVYYSREYSDTNGFRMSEAGMLSEPYDIFENEQLKDPLRIWITGFEQITAISIEDLNIDYHTIDFAKTIAQQQDMLFLGNVGQKETYELYQELRDFTKEIITTIKQDTELEPVTCDYQSGEEYYSTENIYNRLGYWPDEIYRFGIVYVLKDGSTTPVFNMYGGSFESINDSITKDSSEENHNEYGVFKTPNVGVISGEAIRPISFNFKLPEIKDNTKISENVLGWFVVRQKRIPRTICQGLSIGIDKESHLPMIWNGHGKWFIESFLSANRFNYDSIEDQINEYITKVNTVETAAIWGNSHWWLSLATIMPTTATIAAWITSLSIAERSDEKIREFVKAKMKDSSFPELQYLFMERYWAKKVPYYLYNDHYDDSLKIQIDFSRWDNPNYRNDQKLTDVRTKIGAIPPLNLTTEDDHYSGINANYLIDKVYNRRAKNVVAHIFKLYDYNVQSKNFIVILLTNENYSCPQDLSIIYNNESIGVPVSLKELGNIDYDGNNQKNRMILEGDDCIDGWGLLSLDPCVNNTVAGILDGSEFSVRKEYDVTTSFGTDVDNDLEHQGVEYNGELLRVDNINNEKVLENGIDAQCVYIGPETRSKQVNGFNFTNIAGNAASFTDYLSTTEKYKLQWVNNSTVDGNAETTENDDLNGALEFDTDGNAPDKYNINLIRGIFTPYIGVASSSAIKKSGVYSIRHLESDNPELLFKVREQDNSPYYCVTKRNYINKSEEDNIDTFGGDCYTSTVTMRILRNFIDPDVPYVERIISPNGWAKMLIALQNKDSTGEALIKAQENVNLADVNTVDLGYWVTYKCLSSYNLGLRSENSFNVNELALMGSPRSFYPISGLSTATGNKTEESYLLNDGLSATVGEKRYNLLGNLPYTKNEFETRVMFSNKQVIDAFTNGYRTIQGLSYQDYDKQYGAITKLVPWGNNLFCVFEHGLAVLPVNEKALMQTTTEQTIHIYGHGVLPEQMSIVSQDYGSKYADSIIRTPLGIYGIDVDAKKIWRFTDKQGFETISDMKIESFLNQNLNWKYLTPVEINTRDVRTHYNSFKGDVIFTWYYPDSEGNQQIFSICYNERQAIWTTRYDWVPLVSENCNGEFYSLQEGQDSNNNVGIYKHDPIQTNPTKWYGKQHVFEFEFVVSDPIGVHKIFEDLQIISNNVQPEELTFEIIGDSYMFNKSRIYHTVFNGNFRKNRVWKNETTNKLYTDGSINKHLDYFTKPGLVGSELHNEYRPFRNGSLLNDRGGEPVYGEVIKTPNATEQYHLRIPQECRNIETWGRRLGNIHYKNDSWYTNIEPIIYDARLNDPTETNLSNPVTKWNSTRIRDKWCKIRVRYSGEDLSIITAIKTALNI